MTEFERWKYNEHVILRKIARLAGALLNEPTDPAMKPALDELRQALFEHKQWREFGFAHGWQP